MMWATSGDILVLILQDAIPYGYRERIVHARNVEIRTMRPHASKSSTPLIPALVYVVTPKFGEGRSPINDYAEVVVATLDNLGRIIRRDVFTYYVGAKNTGWRHRVYPGS